MVLAFLRRPMNLLVPVNLVDSSALERTKTIHISICKDPLTHAAVFLSCMFFYCDFEHFTVIFQCPLHLDLVHINHVEFYVRLCRPFVERIPSGFPSHCIDSSRKRATSAKKIFLHSSGRRNFYPCGKQVSLTFIKLVCAVICSG